MVFTLSPNPNLARLEWLAAHWARQTGRKVVVVPRPRSS
jgi:hypothetical protein